MSDSPRCITFLDVPRRDGMYTYLFGIEGLFVKEYQFIQHMMVSLLKVLQNLQEVVDKERGQVFIFKKPSCQEVAKKTIMIIGKYCIYGNKDVTVDIFSGCNHLLRIKESSSYEI